MDIASLAQPEKGILSRKIFVDREVYEMEQEKIFAKCWLFLCHETQLKQVGDYFTTYMGEDPVIVVKTEGGKIRAFLNSCRHKGVRLCRTDHGNAKQFTCPYHGWSYRITGELGGVPAFDQAYYRELDRSQWGLIEVAKLDSFHGMIFATWNPNAPSLLEYLGDMAVYLDRMLNRVEGGLEVLGGIHKWDVPTNWKLVAENSMGDAHHVPFAHRSVVDIGFRALPKLRGYEFSFEGGHGFGSEQGGIGGGKALASDYGKFLANLREEQSKTNPAAQFTPLGHGSIFPNFSFLDTLRFRFFRVCHPRGPEKLVTYQWCFVDKAMPAEFREKVRQDYILSFGPSGMFEVEDGEITGTIVDGAHGFIGRNQVFNYQMGLGHERPIGEVYGGDLPGRCGFYWSEIGHRGYYSQWRKMMAGE
jgi:nitrite reductase/ring-hydroxylating ferredoxin subunit